MLLADEEECHGDTELIWRAPCLSGVRGPAPRRGGGADAGDGYAVSVTRAELKDGKLRLDGVDAAPGVFVTVASTTSAAGVRSDRSGAYHVEAVDFRADDCTVVVSDRSTLTETVTLDGCTPTPVTLPPTPPATGDCKITPGVPARPRR